MMMIGSHTSISSNRYDDTTTTTTTNRTDGVIIQIVVVLVCGLPGSGKSTLVRAITAAVKENYSLIGRDDDNDDDEDCGHPTTTCQRRSTGNTTDTTITTIVHTIVYDDIQEQELQLLQQQQHHDTTTTNTNTSNNATIRQHETTNTNNRNHFSFDKETTGIDDTDDHDDIVLQSWRRSRVLAMEQLKQLLQDITSTATTSTNNDAISSLLLIHPSNTYSQQQRRQQRHVILLDDNFYLRSMRKQIYRICCDWINTNNNNNSIDNNNNTYQQQYPFYFGMVHVDTPIQLCLQRNQQRNLYPTTTNIGSSSSIIYDDDNHIPNHNSSSRLPEQPQNLATNTNTTTTITTDATIRRMEQRFERPNILHSTNIGNHNNHNNNIPMQQMDDVEELVIYPKTWDHAVCTISPMATTTASSSSSTTTTSTSVTMPSLSDQVRYVQQWIDYSINRIDNDNNCNETKQDKITGSNISSTSLLYRIPVLQQLNDEHNDSITTQQQRIQNDRHDADIFWRTCVTKIAQQQHLRPKIPVANQVRKYCIQQLQQINKFPPTTTTGTTDYDDDDDHSTTGTNEINEDKRKRTMVWWEMFVRGIPSTSPWLTNEEQHLVYCSLFPE